MVGRNLQPPRPWDEARNCQQGRKVTRLDPQDLHGKPTHPAERFTPVDDRFQALSARPSLHTLIVLKLKAAWRSLQAETTTDGGCVLVGMAAQGDEDDDIIVV